jgi:hypothetical protein
VWRKRREKLHGGKESIRYGSTVGGCQLTVLRDDTLLEVFDPRQERHHVADSPVYPQVLEVLRDTPDGDTRPSGEASS